jgi:hypothetical protein
MWKKCCCSVHNSVDKRYKAVSLVGIRTVKNELIVQAALEEKLYIKICYVIETSYAFINNFCLNHLLSKITKVIKVLSL